VLALQPCLDFTVWPTRSRPRRIPVQYLPQDVVAAIVHRIIDKIIVDRWRKPSSQPGER
jgi:hypothetical protein